MLTADGGFSCLYLSAAESIVRSPHHQLAPPDLQQRFHNLKFPLLSTDHEAADSIVPGQHHQLAPTTLLLFPILHGEEQERRLVLEGLQEH